VMMDNSRQPQTKSHSASDPVGRRQVDLPAQILARSEPLTVMMC
jgi:hypothetical protein